MTQPHPQLRAPVGIYLSNTDTCLTDMAEVKTVISVNGIDGVTLAGSSSHRQPEQDALALVPVKIPTCMRFLFSLADR